MEQRLFHRVTYSTPVELSHLGVIYQGEVQNLSLRGALISSNDCLMVPLGESCTVSISDDREPIVITAVVVHSFFSMAGVKFAAFPEGAEERLYSLMKRISPEPEKLRKEWEEILAHREEALPPPPTPGEEAAAR